MSTSGEDRPGLAWGSRVAYYREKAGLSQAELARATGDAYSRVSIGQVEGGRVGITYPDKFNALRRVLRFPGWEILELMGYRTDAGRGSTINPVLETYILQMDDEQQEALAHVARAFFKHLDPWMHESSGTPPEVSP